MWNGRIGRFLIQTSRNAGLNSLVESYEVVYMVIRINMNRQLLREWYMTGQVTSFPITNPSSDASEVVVGKANEDHLQIMR